MREREAIFHEMGFDVKTAKLPEAGVIYAMARTTNLVSRKLAGVYQPFGLTLASFNLLMLLKHGRDPGSFTQQAIGERLVVSPSNMTGLIDRLERKQWVKRVPGSDRRCHLLRITSRGAALLDQVWPHHAQAIQRLAGALGKAEETTILRVLDRLRKTSLA